MEDDFLEPDDPMPDFVPAQKKEGEDPGFGDIFGASLEAMRATELSTSEYDNEQLAYREIEKAARTHLGVEGADLYPILSELDVPELAGMDDKQRAVLNNKGAYPFVKALQLQAWRNSLSPEDRAKIPDPARIKARGLEIAMERYTEASEIMERAQGAGEGFAKFSGGMTGAMTDPVNIASMFVFRRPVSSFKGAVTYGAVASGSTEAVLQPFVQQYREEVGLPAGWNIGFQNVLFATLGGGVFGGVEGGFIKLGQAIRRRKRQGVADEIDQQVGEIVDRFEAGDLDAEGVNEAFVGLAEREPAFAAALEISQRAAAARDLDGANPYQLTPEAVEIHRAKVANAEAELLDQPAPFDLNEFSDDPPVLSSGEPVPREWAELGIEVVDYAAIQRDAKRFQFKEADGDGLTDALKDVDVWEPERAGALLVWESKDGTRFIANGHQRHALARRLTDESGGPISGPAFILREVDGVSAEDAMVRGALVNIGEGSGTSMDAARILRTNSEIGATLPPRSPLVREARGLAELSDDAFGLVINGQISARNASLVGRLVQDPELQSQIGLALQRVDPRTATEANSIIADLQSAPVVEGKTIDLFGESGFRQALIAERAQVKAAVLRQLASDKRAFGTLNRRADRIEAEGNRLDSQRNADVELDTARLAERIGREAHVKGEVSDALNRAARAVADGQSALQAARGLVDDLSGEFIGSGTGRGADAPGGGQAERAGARAESPEPGSGRGNADLLDPATRAADEFGPDVAALIKRGGPDDGGSGGRFAKTLSQERFEDPRLTRQQNKAVELYRNGFSFQEVADELVVSHGHLSVLFSNARKITGIDIPHQRAGPSRAAREMAVHLKEQGLSNEVIAVRMRAVFDKDYTRKKIAEMLSQERRKLRENGVDPMFTKDALDLASPAELTRMDTLFTRENARTVARALAEAAACAGGVPMSGLGNAVVGGTLAVGVSLGVGGVMITAGTPRDRLSRKMQHFETAPSLEGERRERARLRKAAILDNSLDYSYRLHRMLSDEATSFYRENLDELEVVSQFHANLWGQKLTGVSAEYLDDMIAHESAGDWQARPPVGSAYGGAQFINSTWLRMMKEHGPSYGLTMDPHSTDPGVRAAVLEMRSDRRWGTIMAGEYARENGTHLERVLKRPVTQKEGYLAHFLGSGVALKLLRADPNAEGAVLMPREARNNHNVFYKTSDKSQPRSVREVIARQTRGFSNRPLMGAREVEASGGET